MNQLPERYQRILEAIVSGYIRSAEPVGSRTISRSGAFSLSPATIRNVMADLEDAGLLCQPHTSAGRIPTDTGFRYYVDHLLPVDSGLTVEMQEAVRRACSRSHGGIEDILREGIEVLSRMTPYVSVVSLPHFEEMALMHIRFVRLNDWQILAVIVDVSGMVQHVMFESGGAYDQDDLNRFSNLLNGMVQGMTIQGAKDKLFARMRAEKNEYDALFSRFVEFSRRVFDHDRNADVMIDGKLNLLDHPEFADYDRMKALFRAFEEKSSIIRLLDDALLGEQMHVVIGSENQCAELQGCSLIMAGYGRSGQAMGRIGIIGPTRMEYSRIIPLVKYTAGVIDELLAAR